MVGSLVYTGDIWIDASLYDALCLILTWMNFWFRMCFYRWRDQLEAQLKHYHQNILGIVRDVPVGNSGISSWESERCLFQAMVRNSGNGQNLLGICCEFWRNMQIRFTGTKCLIRHWENFPVWILGMVCKIPTRFSRCLITLTLTECTLQLGVYTPKPLCCHSHWSVHSNHTPNIIGVH